MVNNLMAKKALRLLPWLFIMFLFSCAYPTPYQKQSFNGGFIDKQLDENKFSIVIDGNAYLSKDMAESYFHRRAKEIVQEHGCDGYKVIKFKSAMVSIEWNTLPQIEGVIYCYKGVPPELSPSTVENTEVPLQKNQKLFTGGTGFLFSSRDYIITNYHVIKGASSIEVKFPGGEIIEATVQAKDSQNDIAVLKLAQSPSTQIPDLKFGDSSKVRPGDKVFTIGYPASSILGKNQKITDGIISSVTGIEDDPTMFQITVPIQPGNSGGPLFNERGEVIGITTASLSLNAIQSLGAVPQNVNYAIKSSFVNNLLTTIPVSRQLNVDHMS
jgi:S1-C subfamily serine protease